MRLDVPLIGYAPDADITTKGVVIDCSAFIPTTSGYIGAPSAVSVGMTALAAQCRGSGVAKLLDSTTRLFAGTQTKLYERLGLTWDDVSKVGDYVGGAESRWRFAQYGNATLATNRVDAIQSSVSTGDFANLAGSPPKASIIFTVGEFVMTMDYNDGVDDFPDGWYCSGLGDYQEWDTTDVATQSAKGRLLDVPGQIRAGGRLGSQAVAYKESGMWLGTFQGPPIVWAWQHIPGDAGCVSQEALVEVTVNGGPAHIFLGTDDVYLFDGSRPVSIATGKVREFLQDNMAHQYKYKAVASHDRLNAVIRFYFVSRASGGSTPNMCLAYNYRTNQWGRDDRSVEAALEYVSASLTWDDLGSLYSTWDDLPTGIAYDSPFWSASQLNTAVFDTTHTLVSLTGVAGDSSFTTGLFGDSSNYTTVQRVRNKYNGATSCTGTLTNYYRHDIADTDTTGTTSTLNGSKYDVMRAAKWHKFKQDKSGDYTILAMEFTYEVDGDE